SAGTQYGEECFRRVIADTNQRQTVEQARGLRAGRAMRIVALAMAVEKVCVPRGSPVIGGTQHLRGFRGSLHTEKWLHLTAIGQHGAQFLAYAVGRRLKRPQPGKTLARIEWLTGNIREVEKLRLLPLIRDVLWLLAQIDGQAMFHACQFGPPVALTQRLQHLAEQP